MTIFMIFLPGGTVAGSPKSGPGGSDSHAPGATKIHPVAPDGPLWRSLPAGGTKIKRLSCCIQRQSPWKTALPGKFAVLIAGYCVQISE
jgi:hypothetical protein